MRQAYPLQGIWFPNGQRGKYARPSRTYWKANKTDIVELGYAFKVANYFGTKLIAKDTFSILAYLFKVDRAEKYLSENFWNEDWIRGRNSHTSLMDTLIDGLISVMSK